MPRCTPCQVSAFQMEDSISRLYTRLLGPPTKASEKRAQISGVGFGVSQGIMFLTCALLTCSRQICMLLHSPLLRKHSFAASLRQRIESLMSHT